MASSGKRRFLAALISLFVTTGASASIDAPISLRELYRISSVVAVVEVVEGREVSAGDNTCGARYRARVIKAIKHSMAGQLLDFGFKADLKPGASYLVLLEQYQDAQLERFPGFQERCRSVLPALALAALGRGVMEVTAPVEYWDRPDMWTVRRERLILHPIGTRSRRVDGERQLVLSDLVTRMAEGDSDNR
ncbi:hypothetical protein [Roseateles terrae]|uniref:DUF4136 domain-containing protein n=1 Tax=Roseateles terrae TaxID=431060 RepID=A0ABR6GZ31_9BURK|nr:hypothetical protein [Roseateles terrae]MBB3197370.1 hypothetical protein [Roseateles terrae]OWQ83157.1 hypothetical protein CDN98_23180 [Roseateles terrae]